MNSTYELFQSARKNTLFIVSVLLLALATVVTLFVLENSSPFRFATSKALAWHCESMTASPQSISRGGTSTLTWNFEADSEISVTVDAFPGEEWEGVSGSVEVSPSVTTTYTATAHKVGTDDTYTCTTKVTVLPPEETTNVPACPFTSSSDLVVVDFNGGKTRSDATVLRSDKTEANSKTGKSLTLPTGTFTVKTASWDGYTGRESVSQPNEKWNVEILGASGVLGTVGATTDIKDTVFQDTQIDTFTEAFTTTEESTSVKVTHAVYPDKSSANSVVPICVAFEREKVVVEEPWCELSANPTTITKGNSSTLTWDSGFVSSVDITNVGTGLPYSGTSSVSPTTTTTYIGTFYTCDDCVLTCEASVTVKPPTSNPEPTCSMSASPTQVSKGGSSVLTWTSDEVTSAFIDQGVGDVDLDGNKSVTINENTTFTGTFTDDSGKEVTCTANVSIKTGGGGGGGGGSCLNCGDDDDDDDDDNNDPNPSIILGKTISRTGGFITLDQVPYTGFKAGPMLTLFFWTGIILLSVMIAFFVTRYNPLGRMRMSFVKIAKPVSVSMQDRSETLNVLSPIQDTSTVVASDISSASVPNQNNTVSEIEELAHKENILLSPEALRLIQSKVQETEEGSTQYLAEVIEKAKAEYPREDGWILLSKERAEALMGGTSNNTPIAVENNEAVSDVEVKSDNGAASEKPFRVEQKPLSRTNTTHPSKATAPTGNLSASRNTPSQNLVSAFMGYLLHVQKKEAFDLMRNITTRGVDVATFITLVVRQLDEVYKNRIEGNRSPDQELVTKTDSWTNEDFEAVLGILVECIDYSYSNNRIGTKIALAKVFEHFENKK